MIKYPEIYLTKMYKTYTLKTKLLKIKGLNKWMER